MDLTFVLSAVIFTLLAIVVATSVFNGSSSAADIANGFFGHRGGDGATEGSGQPKPKQNGHVPEKKEEEEAVEDWCEISGSTHDHWDVVKSEEAYPKLQPEEHSSSSTSNLFTSRPESRKLSSDSSLEASSRRSCGSLFGLSDKELLKCAFSHPQSEGATESPEIDDNDADSDNSLRYIPGKARSHHLQMMMSKEELEEEQRVQREQLATIFQLLKENKETFGDVSEGDMEEQLRLYSI
ncbi:hypothetical protein JOB18_003017 [Solea senegalensis]|uniref:Matrix-remodeling-associated protein 7 helical domain-containing protein n=1 Tax=Solea senegalensis TaxID=28829 RepID=A0AAV6RNW4_SOLSE|nr:uncharacterized protein LOC122759614 isoform X2 [Solea senegalensis]KAG7506323.1 hypothetical protein JOB18_003017 [Solea senegalensis]